MSTPRVSLPLVTVQRSLLKAAQIAAKFTADLAERGPLPTLFAKKNDTEGELWIYDVIAEDGWGGISAKSVVDALAALKGVKKLTVRINSPGGSVFEAAAIITNLQNFDAEKVVTIDGIAASAATYIAMAGDRIVTAAHATWMVHEASGFAYGRAEDMRATAELLDKINRTMAETYARQTGKSVDEMLKVMADETWMTAQEALDAGFTDEVLTPAPVEEEPAEPSTATKRALAAAMSTDDRLRSILQARRLEEISGRASPIAVRGQPRPTRSSP
jgi:ATP-dependent Clp endopeptidase proteolytic subunit ClpP